MIKNTKKSQKWRLISRSWYHLPRLVAVNNLFIFSLSVFPLLSNEKLTESNSSNDSPTFWANHHHAFFLWVSWRLKWTHFVQSREKKKELHWLEKLTTDYPTIIFWPIHFFDGHVMVLDGHRLVNFRFVKFKSWNCLHFRFFWKRKSWFLDSWKRFRKIRENKMGKALYLLPLSGTGLTRVLSLARLW